MSTKLHVGNISSSVMEDDLKATFGHTQYAGRIIGVSRSRKSNP